MNLAAYLFAKIHPPYHSIIQILSAMKFKTLFLVPGLSALLSVSDARAITIAEHTAGTLPDENGVAGQSFTTVAGSPASNITFNFFTDVPATTPYAVGTGFLYSMQYAGTVGNLGSGPGFLGQATSDGSFYTFDPALTLSPLTQYFFYINAPALSISLGGIYAGGQGYEAFGGDIFLLEFSDGQSWNFRVTGTPVSGVPDTGASALLLGLSFIGIFVVQRAMGWPQQRVA
jgi:hypothetical protein